MNYPHEEISRREEERLEEQHLQRQCECGTPLEGQYNNGEEHDECAVCRAGSLADAAELIR